MSYKHFARGPWAQLDGMMTWHKLKLLLEYPEQHDLYFKAGTQPPEDKDVTQYLLLSGLGHVTPWWRVLAFKDRRAKGYAEDAAEALDAGLLPILTHELVAVADLLAMVDLRHPEMKGMTLKLYTKKVAGYTFGGLHLVNDKQQVILPKLLSLSWFPGRLTSSNWELQASIARWLTGSTDAGVLMVDDDPPGRSMLLMVNTDTPARTEEIVAGWLLQEYHTMQTLRWPTPPAYNVLAPWYVTNRRVNASETFRAAANTILSFGKHAGQTIDTIGSTADGLRYLEWLNDQAGPADERPAIVAVRVYLADPVIRKAAGHRV